MLKKSFAGLKRKPAKLMTILLFMALLTSIAIISSEVKAQVVNPKITLNPPEAAVGATVTISGTGFSPNEPATFLVGNQAFANAIYSDANGKISGSTAVPDLAAGTYTVLSYDSSGMIAKATFVVTGGGTATATPGPSSSSSGNGNGNSNGNGNGNSNSNGNGNSFPTFTPIGTSSNNFWSPLVIGIIAVIVIAIAIPAVLLLRGQGDKRRMMYERERDRDRPGYGPNQGTGPTDGGGYGQPQGGYGQPTSGYGYAPQPSSYSPQQSSPSGSRYTPYSSRAQSSSSSYQSRYGQSQVHRQVTDQAPMHHVIANHQVTDSNRSQVTVGPRQCIRKLALTANVQLGKIKTSVRTATRKYDSRTIAPTERSWQRLPTQNLFSIIRQMV